MTGAEVRRVMGVKQFVAVVRLAWGVRWAVFETGDAKFYLASQLDRDGRTFTGVQFPVLKSRLADKLRSALRNGWGNAGMGPDEIDTTGATDTEVNMVTKTQEQETTQPPAAAADPQPAADELAMLRLDKIVPSAFNPRKTFDEAALQQLAASIREHGVIKPIVVRPGTLWQQVVGFVARQWALKAAEEPGYGVSKSQMEEVGIRLTDGQFDDAIDLLTEEGRVERSKGVNCMWEPTEGAHQPIGPDRDRLKTGALHYQIVCGERRWRASKLAGRLVIPAIVRDLDDKLAAEIAVIENDQREDVPPLEQGEGYAELVRLGHDAESIAVKIGRPAKYVVARLQLTHLVPELKEDLRTGKLPLGHAVLLAKLQPADQRELRARLYEEYGQDRGRVCSLSDLKRRIRDGRLFPLSAAPWKWDDEALVPEAGSCTKCRKRSGNNPTLFDDLVEEEDAPSGNGKKPKKPKKPPELCTDGACYRGKRDAFIQLQVRRVAEANAGEVVKVSKLYTPGDKEALGKDRYEIVSAKEAKTAKPGELKTAVVVEGGYDSYDDDDDAIDQDVGRVVQVRVKKERKESGGSDSWNRQRAEERKKAEVGKAAAQKACAVVADRVAAICPASGWAGSAHLLFTALAVQMADAVWSDACRAVVKRRGVVKAKGDDDRTAVKKLARSLEGPEELIALIAELVAASTSDRWGALWSNGTLDKDEKAFWSAFGVDKAKLCAAAKAAQKPNAKPAKKAKAKRKAVARG